MNYIAYLWTKFRLLLSGYAVRLAKNRMLSGIRNSRHTTVQMDSAYRRFIEASARQERLAVRFKHIVSQDDNRPVLGLCFEPGEITLSRTAEDIPLYDRTMAVIRHQNGDWGNVPEGEWMKNNHNLRNGCGVVRSKYQFGGKQLFQIETDLTKSKTQIRLERECA